MDYLDTLFAHLHNHYGIDIIINHHFLILNSAAVRMPTTLVELLNAYSTVVSNHTASASARISAHETYNRIYLVGESLGMKNLNPPILSYQLFENILRSPSKIDAIDVEPIMRGYFFGNGEWNSSKIGDFQKMLSEFEPNQKTNGQIVRVAQFILGNQSSWNSDLEKAWSLVETGPWGAASLKAIIDNFLRAAKWNSISYRKAFHLFCSNYIYLDTESIVQLSSKIIADRLDSDNEIAESWVELLSRQNLSVDMRKKLAEMVNSSDKNANNPDFSLGFLDSLFRGPLDELDSAGVGAFAQILINMSGDLRPTFNQYWNKLRRARHFNSDSIDAVTSLVKYGPSKRANQSNIETAALDLTREHIHQLSPTSWATLIYFFYFSNQESIRTKEMTEAWSQLINFPNVSSLAIKEVLDLLDWHYHEIEPNRLKAFLVSLSSMTNFDSAEVVAFYAMIDDYQWKKKRLFAELFGTFLDQGKISKDSLVAYLLRIVQKHSDVDGFTKFISYRRFLKIFLSHKGPWPHSLREAWRIYIGKKILPTDSYDRHFLDSEMSLFFQGFIAHSYNHWNEDIHAA